MQFATVAAQESTERVRAVLNPENFFSKRTLSMGRQNTAL